MPIHCGDTVWMVGLDDHPVMLVMLIIAQVLGHTNFNKNAWRMNFMRKISMNKVKIKSSVISLTFPNVQILICDP